MSIHDFIQASGVLNYFDSTIIGYTWQILKVASSLLLAFAALSVAWKSLVKVITKQTSAFIDFNELWRVIGLGFLMAMYIPMIGSILFINGSIAKMVDYDENTISEIRAKIVEKEINEKFYGYETEEEDVNEKDPFAEINEQADKSGKAITSWDILGSATNPNVLGMMILQSIVSALTRITKWTVTMIIAVLIKVFILIGPLAIMFSALPPFKKAINKWLGSFIALLITQVLFNILDSVIYLSFGSSINGWMGIDLLMFNITMIFCFLMIFWIASHVVGAEDGGAILGAMGTAAAGIASAALLSSNGANKGISNLVKSLNAISNGVGNGNNDAIKNQNT